MKLASSLSYRVDAPELFEPVEEALDDVAFLVEVGVVGALDGSVTFRRDDDFASGLGDPVAQMIGVVALISDRDLGFEAVDQLVREGNVVALPGRADQTHRIAKGVAGDVDLGAQASARPAKALGMRPPFCRLAPAAC